MPESEARSSIRAAAEAIESLGVPRPIVLAYPYGRSDAAVEAAAKAERIELAFTTAHGALESSATRLAEPRLRVNGVVRRPDGTFADGTTLRSILWLLSEFAGTWPLQPICNEGLRRCLRRRAT